MQSNNQPSRRTQQHSGAAPIRCAHRRGLMALGIAAGVAAIAQPALARGSQPPADVSAMDGYAVRFADMKIGAVLRVSGEGPSAQSERGAPSRCRWLAWAAL